MTAQPDEVREAIRNLSRRDCLALLRNINGINTRSQRDIRDEIADDVRFFVGQAFTESALRTERKEL